MGHGQQKSVILWPVTRCIGKINWVIALLYYFCTKQLRLHHNMKKNLSVTFTLLIVFTVFGANAQDVPVGKNYLGIYAGVSQPLGDFKNTNYYNNQSGLARQSITYGINWAHYFNKHIAGVIDLSFQDQGRPSSDALQGLSAGYNADFNAQSTTVTITQRFQNFNILLGPQYSFYFGKFSFDVGASAGLLKSYDTPEYEINVYKQVVSSTTLESTTFYQRSSHASAFAYSGNIGLHYNVSDGFGFAFNAKYVNCAGITITNESNTYTNGRLVTKQPITVAQATLGLFFHF